MEVMVYTVAGEALVTGRLVNREELPAAIGAGERVCVVVAASVGVARAGVAWPRNEAGRVVYRGG